MDRIKVNFPLLENDFNVKIKEINTTKFINSINTEGEFVMETDFKAQSLETWKRLEKLSDEERKRILTNVQATLIEGMELSPEELELLRKQTKGELNNEQFLEIITNLIAQFVKTNGEEKSRRFLYEILIEALPPIEGT